MALIVMTALFYGGSLRNFFYNDDFTLLYASKYRTVADILADRYPSSHFERGTTPYWRPGWQMAFKALYAAAGLRPAPYYLAAVGLHLVITLLIYSLLVRRQTPQVLAFLAGAFFLSTPVHLEAVFWPSAAMNVRPAALLHLLAVWAAIDFARKGGKAVYLASLFLFMFSLTFKEAAYNFPFLFPAALLLLGPGPLNPRKAAKTALLSLPFLAVVILHYAFLNRFSIEGYSLQETFASTFRESAEYFRSILHLPGGDALAWGLAAPAFLALLVLSPAFSRFCLVWAALSLFPFAVRAYASRFAYFCHIPLALYAGSLIGSIASRSARGSRFLPAGAVLLLLAATVFNLASIDEEIDSYRLEGEKCRSILDWCRESGIDREEVVYLDTIVPALANGFPQMLDLFLGARVDLRNLNLLNVPPFMVIGNPAFDRLPLDTVVLQFVPAETGPGGLIRPPSYRKTTKAGLIQGRPVLPMFGFRYAYEVINPEVALKRITAREIDLQRTVLLDREPGLPITEEASREDRILRVRGISITKVAIEVHCEGHCIFLICLPAKLDTPKGVVEVDGTRIRPFRANGIFNALELGPGRHWIEAAFQ